ncbi:hypothetical protein Pmar_PMAR009831 [Perkinsus marinus ATCC 50983]|uniref:Uncharacterized protein n=1 Tax=Perkinsus marinus (strain ATCC 50983 / TXsc) TaxID=423536 RepID=C5KV71_PERM5|nr:hypothetical protein Pmar_PMAR009831 [Perkinsus marinus ATCC 50983]EER11617.1 hypothetical protein Pmar_PMAR009831 [Perkinsus marinus ATCC 50983]|eukprot:XP_002779822.1 hypothetical protein Pmar_PMAR009831 [Perkinsus marinus ATCC 50983]
MTVGGRRRLPASRLHSGAPASSVRLIIFDWDSTLAERSGKLDRGKVLYWLRELRRVTNATIGIMSYNTQGVASDDSLILSELKSSGILGEYVHKENIWGYLNPCHCREDLEMHENMHPIFCGDITSKARAIGRIGRYAGLKPEEILYVDDSYKQIEHAKALGVCHTYQGVYKNLAGLTEEDWKAIIAFLNDPAVGHHHKLWTGSSMAPASTLRNTVLERASGFRTTKPVTNSVSSHIPVVPVRVTA